MGFVQYEEEILPVYEIPLWIKDDLIALLSLQRIPYIGKTFYIESGPWISYIPRQRRYSTREDENGCNVEIWDRMII